MTGRVTTDALPRLPWQVRLSLWLAYYRSPSVPIVPPEVTCMIEGCERRYVLRKWPPSVRKMRRVGCPHDVSAPAGRESS